MTAKLKSEGPRPADSYRGYRRNAIKRGERLWPHPWQTRLNRLDGTNKGRILLNASRPTTVYAKDAR